MSEADTTALERAETKRDQITEQLAALDKRDAEAVEQIKSTQERLAQFEAMTSSEINAAMLVNQERSRRSLAVQQALHERLQTEIATTNERLRATDKEIARLQLPLAAEEVRAQAAALSARLERFVEEITGDVRSLLDRRAATEKLGPVRWTPDVAAWFEMATPLASHPAVARGRVALVVAGADVDPFLFGLAETLRALRAITKSEETRTAVAKQRAADARAMAEIVGLSDREREAAIEQNWPGYGIGPPPVRTTDPGRTNHDPITQFMNEGDAP